jgi:hypothetical protein
VDLLGAQSKSPHLPEDFIGGTYLRIAVRSVCTMMASTSSSEIVRGPPTRGSSYKPSRRLSMKRLRHFPTV